jgi:hypothetical protein
MGPLQLVISGILTLIVYAMALFAVYRIFQISTDVSEIKELLREIRRNSQQGPPILDAGPRRLEAAPQSAEALVRAVHESYQSNALNEK